jgi:hypothetical protein
MAETMEGRIVCAITEASGAEVPRDIHAQAAYLGRCAYMLARMRHWLLMAAVAIMATGHFSCAREPSEGSLSPEDEQALESIIKQDAAETSSKKVILLYPRLGVLVEKYGLVGLARILMQHEREEFRSMGIRLTWNHRLASLRKELLGVLADANTSDKEKGKVMACLALSGIDLEEVISQIAEPSLQVDVVKSYVHNVELMSPRFSVLVWQSVRSLAEDTEQGLGVRREAWRSLAAVRHPFLGGQMWMGDRSLLSLGRDLRVSESMEAAAWAARLEARLPRQGVQESDGVAFASKQLEQFLDSESKPARLEAAVALLETDQGRSKALPVLIGLVQEVGEPLPLWGSVGYRALWSLQRYANGAYLREALDGLPLEQRNNLGRLIGLEQTAPTKEMVIAIDAFLGPGSEANADAKSRVATIVANALRQEMSQPPSD